MGLAEVSVGRRRRSMSLDHPHRHLRASNHLCPACPPLNRIRMGMTGRDKILQPGANPSMTTGEAETLNKRQRRHEA